ncbi:hypothetical protein [Alcaligenes sp. SMD-FA]|uniref:hypothetical protein n=1 Tax=Alcaligenes sp. SMD-FA TaxID=2991054 RepID=UPI002227FAE0|nr:hypothetical protein [Alcaligenes sp. SMD-FA]UYY88730.1 hypothetical protein OKX01_07565 [Alcaligenes sp. SMD-FA]
MKGYPYWKVGLGFSLCPGIAGIIMALVLTYYAVLDPKVDGISVLGVAVGSSFVMALTAIVINIPPAIALAVIYLALRLYRSWQSYLLVAFLGGCGAFFWGAYISPINRGKGYWQAIAESWLSTPFASAFVLGAISSFVMALWVLPKRPEVYGTE